MTNLLISLSGWIGTLLVLLAYALISQHRVTAKSRWYQWLNVVGALGLVINCAWNGAFPAAALNIIWMGIGVAALWNRGRAQG